jgi:ABC-2 type transport system permease protein
VIDSVRVYFKMVAVHLKSQMQYRASFLMMMIGNLLVSFIEFITILVLFSRFDSLSGWRLAEVAMFYGLINVSFALSEAFGRGFDMFSLQVINGEFDRALLRPRPASFLVLSHDFQLMRVGRLLQGLVILAWASLNLGVNWDFLKIGLLIYSVCGGIMIFTGLLIIQATMCFWSTQSLEVINSFTYGGIEALQWPLSIFPLWFSRIFIFVIPLACVNYFPMLAVMGKTSLLHYPAWLPWASPLAGLLFLVVSLFIWSFGVRHYRSTGS